MPAMVDSLAWYDQARLDALVAAAPFQSDGRKVLGGEALTYALNPVSGFTKVFDAIDQRGQTWIDPITDGTIEGRLTPSQYRDGLGRWYEEVGEPGSGQVQTLADYENPTGTKRDRLKPIYLLGAGGVGAPISAGGSYQKGWWTDWGQDVLKTFGIVIGAGVVGAQLAAAEAGGTAAATTTAAEAGSALTIEGATAQGFGSGLGIDGFGAGLGTGLTDVGVVDSLSFLGGYGTVLEAPAVLTFAGQGISLASPSLSLWDQAKNLVSGGSPSSSSSAAPALVDAAAGSGSWLPSAGQVLNGVGAAAGLVGTVAGAAGAIDQLVNGDKPPLTSTGLYPNGMTGGGAGLPWLWIIAGTAGVYYLAKKKG